MSEPPYRESGQVVTNVERHYHFERLSNLLVALVFAGTLVSCVLLIADWRIRVAKIEAISPKACNDEAYDMRDYSVATCDPGATVVHEPGSEFIQCRCPRSTTSP